MLQFWLRSPLSEEAGEGTGAGGGSGAGAGDKSGAIDVAALKADLLGEIRKDLNGIAKGLKIEVGSIRTDFTKLFDGLKTGTGTGTGDGTGAGSGTGDGTGTGKTPDPEKNALQLEIKKLREQSDQRIAALENENKASKTKADEMERTNALRDVLAKYDFTSPDAQADAIQLFTPAIQRSDEGSFVAGDLPLDKYIEQQFAPGGKKSYLIKAKDVGGAGARTGKAATGKKWDVDRDLRPENFSKLTSQEQAELRAHIAHTP